VAEGKESMLTQYLVAGGVAIYLLCIFFLCHRRQRTRNRHRNMRLCRPRDNWPIFTKTGLCHCPYSKVVVKGLDFFIFLFIGGISKVVDEFFLYLSKRFT